MARVLDVTFLYRKLGEESARADLGLGTIPPPVQTPSLATRALPYIAGLGAAAIGYGLHRKVRLSSDPMLRATQQASKGRITALSALEYGEKTRPLHNLKKKLLRGVDEVVEVPYAQWSKGPLKTPKKVRGAVIAHEAEDALAPSYSGDLNLTSNTKLIAKLENKLHEARIWNKEVPGALPKTVQLSSLYQKGMPLDTLQATLQKRFPAGYIVKPSVANASGEVLTHEQNFSAALKDPTTSPRSLQWLKELRLKPHKFIAQEYIPIAKDTPLASRFKHQLQYRKPVNAEYRVHVVEGKVVPGATSHKWGGPLSHDPREISRIEQATQAYLEQLPAEYKRGVPMAMDVVRDINGNYRIIETNAGGQSGYMAPDSSKLYWTSAPHAFYKHVTGRDSQLMAALKALGYGGIVAGSTAIGTGELSGY